METQELKAIHTRLEKLERRVRMTLAGWVVSLAVIVLLGAASQHAASQPAVLRVRSLEIVDQEGRPRIVLSADQVPGRSELRPGVTGIWLLDTSGRHRAMLSTTPDGFASLSFADPARPQQVGTFSLDGMILSDTAGRGRIQFIPDGLGIWDTGRRMRVSLALDPDGGAGLTLFDSAGKPRVALDVEEDARPGLTLFDEAGRKLFHAP